MKPLYLNGSSPMKVGLDGPALRVSVSGSAVQRFPLRRVSRVIVSGSTSWSTDALLACADRGITVCFLKSDGTTRARCLGRPNDRDGFLQRWQDFQDRPDWTGLFDQWVRATRRRAVRMCAWRMGWSPRLDPRSIIRFMLQTTKDHRSKSELSAASRHLRGLAGARAVEVLAQRGLSAPNPSLDCLTPVLVTVVMWSLHPQLTQWLDDDLRPGPLSKQGVLDLSSLACFFERNTATADFYLNDALTRLQRFLMDHQ